MPAPRDPAAVRRQLSLSLAVVLFLATFGSLGVGFGVMTGCTNTYGCTSSGCLPCETTEAWLIAGWIGQGALLAAGVALVVLTALRRRPRTVRLGALALGPLSVALVVVTTALAAAAA